MDDKNIISLYVQRDEAAIKETQTKYGFYCYKRGTEDCIQ